MKELIFNDGRSIEIQSISEANGRLTVRIILTTSEQLKALFRDEFATSKMTLVENHAEKDTYENYYRPSIKEEYGGIWEVELVQKEKDTDTIVKELKEEVKQQKGEIEKVKEDVKGIEEGSVGIEKPVMEASVMVAQIQAQEFTDVQALTVKAIYPLWSGKNVNYSAGTYLNYQEILYKVLQDHTSQESWAPDVSPSLFTKVLVDPSGEILPWEQPDSTNPYMKGDKVTHKGKTWESLVDGNVWEPGVVGTEAQWKEVTE